MLQLTKLIRQNKMTINMEMRWIDTFLRDLDQASNRLSFSIIIAALIIGPSFLLAYSTPPLVYGISLVGMLGFPQPRLGIWLLIAILKKGMLLSRINFLYDNIR